MENYQKLKEVIQSANPEIMELKFGCEVQRKAYPDDPRILVYRLTYYNRDEGSWYTDQGIAWTKKELSAARTYHYATGKAQEYLFILGRPIRLADVLLAIPKNAYKLKLMLDGMAVFNPYENQSKQFDWNLKDDNLDHQSTETIDFLISLLVTGSQ